jgi:uncharacterized protein (DUF302 family)
MSIDMLFGFITGIVLLGLLMIWVMRSKMIIIHASRFGFSETVSQIESAIQNAGWSMVESKRLNDNLSKHGVHFAPKIHLIKLCKAAYAAEVLKDNRRMACLMPCTIAVYEDDNGQAMISKMNTGLMGKVFGGSVARVMGGYVAADETRMLENIIAEK